MSRVSSARILLSLDRHEEALEMIKVFSSSNTNGYIHELTGDILVKQEKSDLAKAQYDIALKKYSDETSKSIVSMKIANIGT
jgi:predicted negative regulator of RcsB-dependent stress response